MIDGAGEEEIAACDQWILPSARLEGVSGFKQPFRNTLRRL